MEDVPEEQIDNSNTVNQMDKRDKELELEQERARL